MCTEPSEFDSVTVELIDLIDRVKIEGTRCDSPTSVPECNSERRACAPARKQAGGNG